VSLYVPLRKRTQSTEREADGALSVRFRAGGMQEICWHLFTWGAAVTVIEPEELRLYLAELAETAAVHHGVQPGQPCLHKMTSQG
jgi:predicted DNA-binding transcriptional regulator YafY